MDKTRAAGQVSVAGTAHYKFLARQGEGLLSLASTDTRCSRLRLSICRTSSRLRTGVHTKYLQVRLGAGSCLISGLPQLARNIYSPELRYEQDLRRHRLLHVRAFNRKGSTPGSKDANNTEPVPEQFQRTQVCSAAMLVSSTLLHNGITARQPTGSPMLRQSVDSFHLMSDTLARSTQTISVYLKPTFS